MAIKREQLTEILLTRFPELGEAYRSRIAWQPEAGSHTIYANVFTPNLVDKLTASGNDESITSAFSFIEELIQNREPGVQDVVAHAVLEPILHHPTALRLAWPFMRETTRKVIWAFADADGLTKKLPKDAV